MGGDDDDDDEGEERRERACCSADAVAVTIKRVYMSASGMCLCV